MNEKEMVIKILEEMGLKPIEDEDGDLTFLFQMKTINVLFFNDSKHSKQFMKLSVPKFHEIKKGDETLALAICCSITRDMKLAKVFTDKDFKYVAACCDFYYTDKESLRYNIDMSLKILSLVKRNYFIIQNGIMS